MGHKPFGEMDPLDDLLEENLSKLNELEELETRQQLSTRDEYRRPETIVAVDFGDGGTK